MDARHHVGTAEPLRVFERRVGDAGAGFQVEKAQHHGGGSQVHGEAVERTRSALDLFAVKQDALPVTNHRRIDMDAAQSLGETR